MKLPPFIYQMIDHIFISDHRGVIYINEFSLAINTTFIKKQGILKKEDLLTTKCFSITKHDKGNNYMDNTTTLINEMLNAANNKLKILLYSDEYQDSSYLFISYLKTHYHFTPEDITRMIVTKDTNAILKKSMMIENK